MKRNLVILLLIAVLFLSSCSQNQNKGENSGEQTSTAATPVFSLPVFLDETLNPLTVKNERNKKLLTLVYDGLIQVTSDLTAKNMIAENYAFEGNLLVFNIKQGIKFSDGSTLTVNDIVYSYNKAKQNTENYSMKFSKIKDFKKRGENEFVAELFTSSEREVNLFDIPIIKENSDLNSSVPIGCGRYVLQKKDGKDILSANPTYYNGSEFSIKEIVLVDLPDADTLFHSLNSGVITAAYTDTSDKSTGIKGDLELRDVTQNNLVFAGLNAKKTYFANPEIRRAISLLINRENMAYDIMLNHAVPAWQPFNPSWQVIKDASIPETRYSADEAQGLLASGNFKKSGDFLSYSGGAVKLKIVVNLDNRMRVDVAKEIADNLSKAGFDVEVSEQKWDAYLSSIKKGDFDIYLGEVIIPMDMDISVLFKADVNYTGLGAGEVQAAMAQFDADGDIGKVIEAFDSYTAIVPLFYKNGALAISKRVSGTITPVPSDIFGSIETWKIS